ncbi:MAG TPA: type IX secretion system membrane protein PorP/SprF [Draconibacterium sp.]|nr:type IX secretion system membrane protein PorP/SprF [Draconibacterium sp.]
MNKGTKIFLIVLFALNSIYSGAQNESPLLPFFNPLIVNPAFAGMDKISSFRTGNQYSLANSASSYNLFYATYDTYSEKLKGGIAFYFQQGLIGSRNISTTELGFAYAGIPKKTNTGVINFGFNTNILLATKQWIIAFTDKFTVDGRDTPNPPGTDLLRYSLIKPRVSFLWHMPDLVWGASLGSSLKINLSTEESSDKQFPFNASLYVAKNSEGFRKGLHSQPFVIIPELMIYYTDMYLLGRLNLYTEFTSSTLGVFLNGDFLNNEYSVGGIGGLASNNFRLNLALGTGYSVSANKVGFTGELSLILKVQQFDYSKINPWAPRLKSK